MVRPHLRCSPAIAGQFADFLRDAVEAPTGETIELNYRVNRRECRLRATNGAFISLRCRYRRRTAVGRISTAMPASCCTIDLRDL